MLVSQGGQWRPPPEVGRPGEGTLSDGFPGITTKAALPSTQLLTEKYELSMGEKKKF